MPDLIVPGAAVTRVSRYLRRAAAITESPFTFQQQVQIWGGTAWAYDIEFGPQRDADARALDVIFNALGGPSGVFLFEDPTIGLASVPGTPLVQGGGQTGASLVTDGWTISTTVLRAGEFFSLGTGDNTRLYQLTADAVSSGAGVATLAIQPELRISPTDNDPLTVAQPRVALRLTGPAPGLLEPGIFYRFSVTAQEAL